MATRIPTRDELRAAHEIEGLEDAVASEKLTRIKVENRDPLTSSTGPKAPRKTFTLQDMLTTPIPSEPAKGPSLARKVSDILPGGTQLGVKELLQEHPEIGKSGMTDVQKAITRIGIETAAGAIAMEKFGPPGAAVGATEGFIRALPPLGRALAVSFPRTARAVQAAPIIGGGNAVGSLISEGFDPSENPLGNAGLVALLGAGGEFATPVFSRSFERLRQGGFELKKGAREVVEQLLEKGQAVSPGFFSKNYAIQVLDNVSSGSMFGGGHMRAAQLGGANVLQESTEDFLSAFRTFASDSIEVQRLTKELLEGSSDAFRLIAKKKYGIIDEIAGEGVRVNVKPLFGATNKILKEAGGENAARPLIREMERLMEVGSIRADGTMTFEGAADLRSFMLGLQRAGPEQLIPGRMKALGGNLARQIDRQMEQSFRQGLPDTGVPKHLKSLTEKLGGQRRDSLARMKTAWREANAFWKTGMEDVNSTLVKSLTKSEPRQVALAIRGNTRNIRQVKRLLTEGFAGAGPAVTQGGLTGKQVFREIQGEIINDMANKSMTELADHAVFTGSKMLRRLRNSKEQMTELLGKDGYDNMVNIFEKVHIAQGGGADKELPGKVFITFKQAGAISEIGGMVIGIGQGASPGAVALLAGPAVVGRLLTSKAFTKWALLGLDPKTPAVESFRAINQMMAMAVAEGATPERVESSDNAPTRSPGRRPIPAFITGPSAPSQ